MKHKKLFAHCGAVGILVLTLASAALAAGAGTASAGPAVTVRVEGPSQTLLAPTVVHTHSGSVTRFGAPSGKCPDTSAQGALDIATHHSWSGKWFSSYNEYEIFTILGHTESGTRSFWEFFVNNVAAPSGACDTKLRAGDQLLFAAVPVHGATEYPLVLSAPRTATVGHVFTVKVVYFVKQHVSHPLAGARVSGDGVKVVTTNSRGEAKLHSLHAGRVILYATHADYIRSGPAFVTVS